MLSLSVLLYVSVNLSGSVAIKFFEFCELFPAAEEMKYN